MRALRDSQDVLGPKENPDTRGSLVSPSPALLVTTVCPAATASSDQRVRRGSLVPRDPPETPSMVCAVSLETLAPPEKRVRTDDQDDLACLVLMARKVMDELLVELYDHLFKII